MLCHEVAVDHLCFLAGETTRFHTKCRRFIEIGALNAHLEFFLRIRDFISDLHSFSDFNCFDDLGGLTLSSIERFTRRFVNLKRR